MLSTNLIFLKQWKGELPFEFLVSSIAALRDLEHCLLVVGAARLILLGGMILWADDVAADGGLNLDLLYTFWSD